MVESASQHCLDGLRIIGYTCIDRHSNLRRLRS